MFYAVINGSTDCFNQLLKKNVDLEIIDKVSNIT